MNKKRSAAVISPSDEQDGRCDAKGVPIGARSHAHTHPHRGGSQ